MTSSRVAAGLAAILLAPVLLVAGCSGGSDGDNADRPSPTGSSAPTAATSSPSAPTAAPSAGTEDPPPELAGYYGQKPRWTTCDGLFECATLTVPLDYAAPADGDIELSLVRLPVADGADRIGSLVLNPGGPGGSGLDYARAARSVTSEGLRDRFDIVGFDPRGVGESTPLRCRTDAETDAFVAADASPDDAAEEKRIAAVSALLGRRCAEKEPELVRHVSTVEAARDLDVLRAALGDEQLHYLGKSYGTYLGATYAQLFPGRVGALVLDGAIDPALPSDAIDEGQAKGFEVAVRAFVEDCLTQDDCPLPGPVDAGLDALGDLLADVDAEPLPSDDSDREVTEALVVLGIAATLYDESDWPLLRQAIAEAQDGDGTTMLLLADFYTDRGDDGRYSGNSNDVIYAVNCLDRPATGDLAATRDKAVRFAKVAPLFGRYLAWSSLPCATWPVPATGTVGPLTAEGAAPILVVGTTRDPATPYAWAVSLAGELESGVLLSVDGDGHTAYLRGNDCADRIVDAYLLGTKVPTQDQTCD